MGVVKNSPCIAPGLIGLKKPAFSCQSYDYLLLCVPVPIRKRGVSPSCSLLQLSQVGVSFWGDFYDDDVADDVDDGEADDGVFREGRWRCKILEKRECKTKLASYLLTTLIELREKIRKDLPWIE